MELEYNRQWLKDIPFVSTRFAIREIKERLRVLVVIAGYLDDVSEAENSLGKSLLKINSQPSGRSELLPVVAATVENILKSSVQLSSRNHASFASTIGQSIGKPLPDFSKSNSAKISGIVSKIQFSVDEFRKLKTYQQKLQDKYAKLIQETENAIKARDAAFLGSEAGKEHDKEEKGSFMNRSLNKVKVIRINKLQLAVLVHNDDVQMFAKITPEDNKKRLIERCKELLKELEATEISLSSNSLKLKSQQAELKEDVGRSLCEIKDLEESRLAYMRDTLNKLCVADDFFIDRAGEAAAVSVDQVSAINIEAELATLFSSVESLVETGVVAESTPEGCSDLIAVVDKLVEAFDYVKSTLQRLNFGLLEVIEAEKSYCKTMQKLVDKHLVGAKSSSNRRASATAASMGIVTGSGSVSMCELLNSFESPSTKNAWDQWLQSYLSKLDASHQLLDSYTDRICIPLENLIASVAAARKDLLEKKNTNVKCLDAAQANLSKCSSKLTKVQQQLKERRSTVRKAKEDLNNESLTSSSAAEVVEADDAEVAGSPPDRNSAIEGDLSSSKPGGSGSMMKSLEKMRNTKLSLVVGLETKADRINRIDTQISGLEDEEEELTLAHASAALALNVATENCRKDIASAIDESKVALTKNIKNIKPVLDSYIATQNLWIEQSKRSSTQQRSALSQVDISKDTEHFVSTFVSFSEGGVGVGSNYQSTAPDLLNHQDFSPIDLFERVPNELIDEERQLNSQFTKTTASPANQFAAIVNAAVAQQTSTSQCQAPAQSTPSTPNIGSPVRSANDSPINPEPLSISGAASAGTPSRVESPPPKVESESEVVKIDAKRMKDASLKDVAPTPPSSASVLGPDMAPSTDSWGVSFSDVCDFKPNAQADFGVAAADIPGAGDLQPAPAPVPSAANSTPSSVVSSLASVAAPIPSAPAPSPSPSLSPATTSNPIGAPAANSSTSNAAVVQASVVSTSAPASSSGSTIASSVKGNEIRVAPNETSNRKSTVPIASPNSDMNANFQSIPATVAPTPSREAIPSTRIGTVSAPTSASAAPAGAGSNADNDHELAKFGLNSTDRVLESFSCALYPKKGIGLTHGRMYITQYFLAFQGWPETRVLIPLSNIIGIEKMNTVGFIPNAILVKVDGNEFFFGSFLDRDQCYQLLRSMSDVVKRIIEVHGKDVSTESRNLVIGLQKDALGDMLGSSNAAVKVPESIPDVVAPASPSTPTTAISTAAAPEKASQKVSSASSVAPASSATQTSVPTPSPTAAPPKVVLPDEPDDGVTFANTYTKNAIHLLAKETIKGCCSDEVWKACWLNSGGFRDFLVSEGDLDVVVGEWKPFSANIPEDVSKLPFCFSRSCTYAHPRTTMLMFGPKNAPAKQTQFLYVWGRSSSKCQSFEELQSCSPKRALVLTMTQFDGIPMADMFKVLQYWGFEDQGTSQQAVTQMSIGCHIHFIKSTMLKGQVVSGVRDELAVLSKKYIAWCRNRTEEFISNLEAQADSQAAVASPSTVGTDSTVATPAEIQPKPRLARRLSAGPSDLTSETTSLNAGASASGGSFPDSYFYALVVVIILLLILFVLQWWTNRGLQSQISAIEARMDAIHNMLDAKLSKSMKGEL